MVWNAEIHRSWKFHVGKNSCSSINVSTIFNVFNVFNVWCACMWWKWEAPHFFQWRINTAMQSQQEDRACKRTEVIQWKQLFGNGGLKDMCICNGLCLWSESAFNLLMPLSESIHFLQWIKKLLSHVLTLFCLLSIVCCCFRVYMHIKTVGYIALSKIEISTIICPKSIKLTKKWPIWTPKSHLKVNLKLISHSCHNLTTWSTWFLVDA